MRLFFKIIRGFFLTLGVLFFVLILFGVYIWQKDPLHVWSEQEVDMVQLIKTSMGAKVEVDGVDTHPLLTEEQEAQVESFGIDPATLPTELTPEMTTCLKTAIGEQRLKELQNGASPTPEDVVQGRSCL